ncbi:hypothetical protein [Microbacterium rhizosphaerae]|uniref:Uncharacterized protein n=1 Tax=Microbacterium rhizosphaerae TaxID=1678237 RepID=A0ABZ0SRE0_9MICO|nr:hypothetical protein [Microbacterium rhizosphaerae]WPR91330.1 hypothetical protein SM116_08655 [Microbacterium rhizosphaerae]
MDVPPIFNAPALHERFKDLAGMRAFAQQIIDWWDRDRGRDFKMKTEYVQGAGPIVWTYATHAVEVMRVVLRQSELGRMAVVASEVRLMIELGMTSIWLYLQPVPAAKALLHETLRQHRATVRDAIAVGHDGFEELLKRLDAEQAENDGDSSPTGKSFEQRCRAIDGGLEMYVMWRLYSRMSHATGNLADHYLLEVPISAENPLGIALNPDGEEDTHESSLGLAICMLLVALKACDLIDAEGRRTTQIRTAAKKIGLGLDFKLIATE